MSSSAFIVTRTLPDFYGDGLDSYVYSKSLC